MNIMINNDFDLQSYGDDNAINSFQSSNDNQSIQNKCNLMPMNNLQLRNLSQRSSIVIEGDNFSKNLQSFIDNDEEQCLDLLEPDNQMDSDNSRTQTDERSITFEQENASKQGFILQKIGFDQILNQNIGIYRALTPKNNRKTSYHRAISTTGSKPIVGLEKMQFNILKETFGAVVIENNMLNKTISEMENEFQEKFKKKNSQIIGIVQNKMEMVNDLTIKLRGALDIINQHKFELRE